MYLRDLKTSLFRRWYLVVVGLLIAGGLAYLTYQFVPATYQAKASVVLLPPKTTVGPGGNPYLQLGGLGQALDVLSRKLSSDAAHGVIQTTHPDSTYDATTDPTSSGPILIVSAEGKTPTASLETVRAVLDSVPAALRGLQTDLSVPDAAQITSMTLTADSQPKTNDKTRVQAVVAVAVVAVAGSLLLTGLTDGLLMGRRAKRADRKDGDDMTPAGTSVAETNQAESRRRHRSSGTVERDETLEAAINSDASVRS